MSKHTPAPWKAGPVFQHNGRAIFYTDTSRGGKWNRRLDADADGKFTIENAHLIAAAPELLASLAETLEAFLSCTWDGNGKLETDDALIERANAALAKARGDV